MFIRFVSGVPARGPRVTRRLIIEGIKFELWQWFGSSVSDMRWTHASSTYSLVLRSTLNVNARCVEMRWTVYFMVWFGCFASFYYRLEVQGAVWQSPGLNSNEWTIPYLNWQNLHSYPGGLKGRPQTGLWCFTIQDDPFPPGNVLKVIHCLKHFSTITIQGTRKRTVGSRPTNLSKLYTGE